MIRLVWCALMLTILFGGLLYALTVRRLRRHHPLLWRSLGEPREVLAASTRPTTIGDFLRKGEYRHLGDRTLARLANAVRVATLFSLLFFGFGVLLILVATIHSCA